MRWTKDKSDYELHTETKPSAALISFCADRTLTVQQHEKLSVEYVRCNRASNGFWQCSLGATFRDLYNVVDRDFLNGFNVKRYPRFKLSGRACRCALVVCFCASSNVRSTGLDLLRSVTTSDCCLAVFFAAVGKEW